MRSGYILGLLLILIVGCKSKQGGVGQEVTLPSGLKYVDLIVGRGPEAKNGSRVFVHYTGWLEDGTEFDNSIDRHKPFSFTVGGGQVIKGWDEGVKGMRVDGRRKLIIPPSLAYGEQGIPGVIPPDATLIFDIKLLKVE